MQENEPKHIKINKINNNSEGYPSKKNSNQNYKNQNKNEIELSIVIPLLNEEDSLRELYQIIIDQLK